MALFVIHGALWLALKLSDEIGERALRWARKAWHLLLAVAVVFLAWTALETGLRENYLARPYWLVVPAGAVVSLLLIRLLSAKKNVLPAFLASCAAIVLVTFTGMIGLYPNLIPSRLDPAFSLTVFNASSSPYTLRIMTIVALVFVPIVIAYQIWVYRIFRHKIGPADAAPDEPHY
jgi:cytochrome d ubiquinol oxidase subunit II